MKPHLGSKINICLGGCQTEAEGVPSQGGRGDALLRPMPQYMTCSKSILNMDPKNYEGSFFLLLIPGYTDERIAECLSQGSLKF